MLKILRKYFSTKLQDKIPNDKKIKNFYTFMEENMNKVENINKSQKVTSQPSNEALTNILKCPMTESNLEVTEEGLKVGHILYPKRNGIYILVEEEAQFNF